MTKAFARVCVAIVDLVLCVILGTIVVSDRGLVISRAREDNTGNIREFDNALPV